MVVVLAILAGLGYYGWVKVTDFFTAPPTQDAPTQATQPAASDPDAPKVIAAQTYGCVTPQEFWRGKMLVIQNDREAFGEYLADAIARGRCAPLSPGAAVFVSDFDTVEGYKVVQVHLKGSPELLWIGASSLQ